MRIPGKIINSVGNIIGDSLDITLKVSGNIIGNTISTFGNENLGLKVKKISKNLSLASSITTKTAMLITAHIVDASIDIGEMAIGEIKKHIVTSEVRLYGDSKSFYNKEDILDVDYEIID